MGNDSKNPIKIQILLNGKSIGANMIEVAGHKLYKLADFANSSEGVLEIVAQEPGLEMYTFTFCG